MQACWRNVYRDGVFIDALQLDPLLFDLPKSGVLRLDFVSYDTPSLRHADLLCRLQTLRARLFRVKPPSVIAATACESIAASVPQLGPASPGARPTHSSMAVSPGAGVKMPHASVKFSGAADGGASPSGRGASMAGEGGVGGTRTTRSSTRAGVAPLMALRTTAARQCCRMAQPVYQCWAAPVGDASLELSMSIQAIIGGVPARSYDEMRPGAVHPAVH